MRLSSGSFDPLNEEIFKSYSKKYHKYVIDSNHPLKVIWDAFIAVIVIYSVIIVPIQLSFNTVFILL